MRTTVTLDDDAERLLRARMAERGISFKQALNDAIRRGLEAPAKREPFRTETKKMGVPLIDLTKANQLAGELEDQEIVRKLLAQSQ